MASIDQDIIIFKNRYHTLQFTVDGVADLVGYEARWASSTEPGATAIVVKSTEGETPKITIDNLKVIVSIEPGDFSSETAGEIYHELILIDDSARAIQGAFGILDLRDVTVTNP